MPRSAVATDTRPAHFVHLATFARLRRATIDDVAALRDLGRAAGAEDLDWERVLAGGGRDVVVAFECDALIGAVVTERTGTLVGQICWIGVARSARRNGVGRLLVETAAENMLIAGVGILRFRHHLMGYGVHQLLAACSFQLTPRGYERRLRADRA